MENIFNRIIKTNIYLLVFLLPLFFLPFSFEAFEFNKQYLLFFLVSLALFAWLAKMVLVNKEFRFKKSPLDLFVLAFLFIAILSAVFSVDKSSSLFGFYGRFSDGLIGLLSLGVLYFLITNNVSMNRKQQTTNNEQRASLLTVHSLLKVFLWSVFFVISISYLSIFGPIRNFISNGVNILGFNLQLPRVMLQSTFNPAAGSMEGLSVFLAVIVALLIGYLVLRVKRKLNKIAVWILFLASLFLILIVDFTAAWIVLLTTLVLFITFALWKRMFKEDVNRLLLPILLIIIAGVFISVDTSKLQSLILNYQLPQEQVLNQGESWGIGFKGAVENVKSGFLGSGVGTFHYDFSKFKSVEFNQNLLWQIRFDRAGNHIAEVLGTIGFLGILSYLGLIGFFLLLSYFFLLQRNLSAIPLLMAFLALLIAQFVYYQNTTLAFAFWLVLGLLVVSWQKPIKEKVISFKDFPELSLVFSALLIIFGIAVLGMYFFAAKFYLADINYKNAVGADKIERLEKAVNLNPYQPHYRIILARNYLNRAAAEILKPLEEQNQDRFACDTTLAVAYTKGQDVFKICLNPTAMPGETIIVKGALQDSPKRVSAWETLGMIYREIQGVKGALEKGVEAFEKAITLEPANPVLYTELGKLYLNKGEIQTAREKLVKAKELKPDYIDALFQLGRLYFNNDQIDEAISEFETVISIFPLHSNSLYSLGLAYNLKGEKDLAIQAFERVLQLNPDNQDVREKLEELKK